MMPQSAGATTWQPHDSPIVIARGSFKQSVLEGLALDHGGKVEQYRSKTLLTHANETTGNNEMAVAFLDVDLVAFGSYASVKSAIDAKTGANVLSNPEMMRQINELDATTAWAVGRFDALAREARLPSEISSQVSALQWFSAAAHVNGGVSGVIKAETKDAESAKNLRDVLNGFLALAKMQAGSKPELKAMVDSLQLAGDDNTVSLAFTVPSEVFEALEAMKGLHGHEAPRQ